MRSLNKKGFAPIITITVLILVSLSSIFLLWGIAQNIGPQLAPATDCAQRQINKLVDLKQACLENTEEGNRIKLTLMADLNYEGSEELSFTFGTSSNPIKFNCENSCGCIPIFPGQTKDFYAVTEETSNNLVFFDNGCLIREMQITSCK